MPVRTPLARGIGITNQRETVCVWDPSTGEPLHRALVWQDRRTAARCDELREQGHESLIRERTGLVLDPYFSGTKIEWLLRNVDGLEQRAREGRAVFGTIDSWLTFKLTGEFVDRAVQRVAHAAVRHPARRLGRGAVRAARRADAGAARGAAVRGRVRNGVAARLRGAGRRDRRRSAGRALRAGVPRSRPGQEHLRDGLVRPAELRRRAAGAPGGTAHHRGLVDRASGPTYALEAAIFVTGAAVQWLRDGLGIIGEAAETEALAASLESNDGVYFVPALTGLGSPHWDPYARGTIVGLTRGSGRAHLARATLEAMAYQTFDAVEAMSRGGAPELRELKADGGATVNGWLMQFQADILGVPVVMPEIEQTTALGAASLAAVGAGLWSQDAWSRGGANGAASSRRCAMMSAARCSPDGTRRGG